MNRVYFSACALGCLTSFALSGCGPTTESENPTVTEDSDQAIFGGTVTTGDPAVMLLTGPRSLCTGTLVSPRVVLTAAHCFNPNDRVTVAGRLGLAKNHPTYNKLGTDIGVVVLDQPIHNIEPLTVATPQPGVVGRKVGFGNYDAYRTPDGRNASLGYDGKKRTVNVVFSFINGNNNLRMGTSACYGDSGGPTLQFISGKWRIVGVSSYVDNARCLGRSYDWVAERGYSWVQSEIEQNPTVLANCDFDFLGNKPYSTCSPYGSSGRKVCRCFHSNPRVLEVFFASAQDSNSWLANYKTELGPTYVNPKLVASGPTPFSNTLPYWARINY